MKGHGLQDPAIQGQTKQALDPIEKRNCGGGQDKSEKGGKEQSR